MRNIILLIISFFSFSLYAQTDEQIVEWIQQGQTAEEQGNISEAVRYTEMLREGYARRFGTNDDYYVLIVDKISKYYNRLGNYAKAAERELELLEILRQTAGVNNLSYIMGLGLLANYYSQMGDNDKAIEYGSQAVELTRSVSGQDNATYATLLSNLAVYNDRQNNFTKALELEGSAMRIKRRLLGKNHVDYAVSLNNLALFNSHLGNNEKALELGMRALDIFRSVHGEKHVDCATTLDNIATFYSHYNQTDRAIEIGTKAASIYREVLGEKHPDYAASLSNLASYYAANNDFAKAVELGGQAVMIQVETLGAKHPSVASSLDNLSGYYAEINDCEKAIEMGGLASMVFKEIYGEHHPDYAMSLANLSSYTAQKGDYVEAMDLLRQALEILQDNTLQQFCSLPSSRRTNFWTKYAFLFTEIYPSMAYLSKVSAAPDLYDKSALFAKGLLLSTELEVKRLIQESGDAEAVKMLDNLQSDRQMLQVLNMMPESQRFANADSLARVISRQERKLMERSQAFGNFTNRLRVTWKDVQQALKEDEVAIEFLSFNLWNSDKTMLVALTLRKDDKEPILTPLFENSHLSSVSDPQFYNCPELTSLVWQPLTDRLKDIRRIYFSSSGVLHNIGIEYAPGMEQYEMYRLSTTREIIDMKAIKAQSRKLGSEEVLATLFGGVDYSVSPQSASSPHPSDDTDISEVREQRIDLHRALVDSLPTRGMSAQYLPSTLSEVESIYAALDKKRHTSNLFTGAEASETSVRSLSTHAPHILHIATHGFYFTEKQVNKQKHLQFVSRGYGLTAAEIEDKALTRSGLLLAGANRALKGGDIPLGDDDGILTAKEISNLDLRGLDLVVLSACKTGKGDVSQGEGVFGLQRGFKKAGAQSLIMSLWDVADEATQILMTAFYENLLQGQSKRQAFQHAQQHLRTVDNGQFDHPQFWAAFILLD